MTWVSTSRGATSVCYDSDFQERHDIPLVLLSGSSSGSILAILFSLMTLLTC